MADPLPPPTRQDAPHQQPAAPAQEKPAPPKEKRVSHNIVCRKIRVDHLTDYLDIEPRPSPLLSVQKEKRYKSIGIVPDSATVVKEALFAEGKQQRIRWEFPRCGARSHVYWAPSDVRAAIVTCGGLCPGLNTVVREIVNALFYLYDVTQIFGIRFGYRGFYEYDYVYLTPSKVSQLHTMGGSWLGSSRGGFDLEKIMNAIVRKGLTHLYIIGGDGTHRAADKLYREARKRKIPLSVVGIPKTVDNDIPIIDKSFGFDTAVENAQVAIRSADVEARSSPNGVGLVKLMGRDSGFIAVHATLSSRDVHVCLIPEIPFDLEGPHGLLEFLLKRLQRKGNAVVVVAEGCGKYLVEQSKKKVQKDASGNTIYPDAGLYLQKIIKRYFAAKGMEINLKYLDPTYTIRSTTANASDQHYCFILAQHAVHGAMAGYTGFTVGCVSGRFVYIPFWTISEMGTAHVDPSTSTWSRLLYSTGMPSFKPPTTFANPVPRARL